MAQSTKVPGCISIGFSIVPFITNFTCVSPNHLPRSLNRMTAIPRMLPTPFGGDNASNIQEHTTRNQGTR